ncbi:MAG: endopeptidase La [Deltaproteobacteria bacterium RIFOXYD12_FULL_56_24]|nr:MAG: endopeptidase La [Deltaproteobacteria bacterium RIFOXYD12_FULL_56_24]
MSDDDKQKEAEIKEQKAEQRGNPKDLPVPEILPVLPLHGFVFFPGMGFPMNILHSASQKLIDESILKDRLVAIVSHRESAEDKQERVEPRNLYRIGVLGYIHKLVKVKEGGGYQVLISAIKKLELVEFVQEEPYLAAKVAVIPMAVEEDKENEALVLNIRTQFKKLAEMLSLPVELVSTIEALSDPFYISYLVISQLNITPAQEQEILEIEQGKALMHRTARELNKRLETAEMSQDIQKSIKEDTDQKQREFFLRQQLKAIRKELGEEEENLDLKELREKFAHIELPAEAQKTAEKELDRLARISPSSPEYTVSRTYLDWLLDLPWLTSTPDSLDIVKAQKVMDEDHYGLAEIKKRIIEFLAVRKLKQDMHGPILCFVGPPGVGKTSLGQSIARSMGRKFIRISLGGVRDEAEIRGHRRTYIGALPGRIIQSLRKAGANNPLFMLDEIDKLGMDFRGDPSSALLEVLDPEQNFTFADHYLEIPFDLSKVMFITTANLLDNIPGPLRDRMEVIELSGYTQDEKLNIARRHLLPKQLEAHAISDDDLKIDDQAMRSVIRSYTREAGVRNLERRLAAICRGVAKEIVTGKTGTTLIDSANLATYLGPIQFFPETKARSWGPGLATGLAWTPVGGELLFIEVAKMKGKGGLTMTGKLGEVMKESATAALTYIRSHAKELGVDEGIFARIDLHIHVPEGAIPKDGPSAGVAMVTALTSLLTGRTVSKDMAMTGEITLRGDVLPVGGIKEKVLAAVRAGIKEIVLPALNEKDVMEIPDNVKEDVRFHLVQDIKEALAVLLAKEK